MENILISSGLAFLITFFGIPVIIKVAKDKKLYDVPGDRKIHKEVIPTLGGLGIFAGFIFAVLMAMPAGLMSSFQYFLAAIMLLFFMGIKDDILILTAGKKFAGQLVAAAIVIQFGGVHISDMFGIIGVHTLPPAASFLLTMFTIVVITNSFNLIDGVDGLAGSLGVLTTLLFGTYFYFAHDILYTLMAFSLAGSLIGFLYYNFSPAKIFMGDTGSLLIGFVNSLLVIHFINTASSPSAVLPVASAAAVGFAILMIPLFDTLRVVGLRLIQKRSPFWPDRSHIHHLLLDQGMSHKMITISCVAANILFVAMSYFLRVLGSAIDLLFLVLAAILSISIIYSNRPKKRKSIQVQEINATSELHPPKIITLIGEPVEQH